MKKAEGAPHKSGIMVLEQKPARKQGAPNRCCYRGCAHQTKVTLPINTKVEPLGRSPLILVDIHQEILKPTFIPELLVKPADEVRICNRAPSAAEINALSHSGGTPNP